MGVTMVFEDLTDAERWVLGIASDKVEEGFVALGTALRSEVSIESLITRGYVKRCKRTIRGHTITCGEYSAEISPIVTNDPYLTKKGWAAARDPRTIECLKEQAIRCGSSWEQMRDLYNL